jgi:hypothetical protein
MTEAQHPVVSTSLSSNDAKILSILFDPESTSSQSVNISKLPQSLPGIQESLLPSLQTAERSSLSHLDSEDPSPTDVRNAISGLNAIISQNPSYASAYANRAQARRLLLGSEIYTLESADTLMEIFSDLSQAIELAAPVSPSNKVSPVQARVLATAHTHRGFLLLKAAKAVAEAGTLVAGPQELVSATREQIEEMAAREFATGGRYGDKIARQLAVEMNPYAKACGAIVKEALREEMKDRVSAIQ